jgi:hypothetical protein
MARGGRLVLVHCDGLVDVDGCRQEQARIDHGAEVSLPGIACEDPAGGCVAPIEPEVSTTSSACGCSSGAVVSRDSRGATLSGSARGRCGGGERV